MHAPAAELRGLLTQSFEEWSAEGVEKDKPNFRKSCALSGEGTALVFLPALRNAAADWSRIALFWTDEFAVPATDPESNYGIAERMLLNPLGAQAPRAFRMPADQPSLGQAAMAYDVVLSRELKTGPLDLALLGVGEDGHICALFPGHPALLADDLRVVAVEDAPRPPVRRLSLTLPFLLRTRKIWVIALGARKLPVLNAALLRTRRQTPLDLLLHHAKDVTVFTDQVIRRV